uniref:BMERB domain-containing protein n=1 Tax=Gouania willdenowi TaxID=441366 RepID=A0A8C5GVY6_GOUWI
MWAELVVNSQETAMILHPIYPEVSLCRPSYLTTFTPTLISHVFPRCFHFQGSCKENPFNQKPAMAKSKTFSDLLSSRGPAPGHGFPLIKRKVQTDHLVPTENLQLQLSELHKHLEAVEQRGIELERRLRDCYKEEMLTEWFSLVHQRHVLSYKDTELVYQLKQQKLDDRQSDVEYELRCLLNKPEGEWSRDDRGREQQLMEELVAVIDQRNQIINSLDRDRQRAGRALGRKSDEQR